jgi:ElaB/YqjD/DUF883 family membrane-anchored ribosome-binding protein
MNPRRESGYDPIGDPRTGRPPLPEERERMRRREPEEMDPSEISSARATSLTDEQSNEEDSMSQSLREAGEAVSVRVTEAASSAMEQGSALASAASGQLQTYTDDLLAFARRRPFAALLGAAVIGLLIGMLSRSRS